MAYEVETIHDNNGGIIKEITYSDGKIWMINEYEKGEEVKQTMYSYDGKPMVTTEYENGEEVKITGYNNDDGKIIYITEYEDGEEVKSTHYNDGKIFSITEYEDGEEVLRTSYSDGKISLIHESENGEEVKMTHYNDGKISSIYEYEDGEESRSTSYENGKLFILSESENGEETLNIVYKDNQIFRYTKSKDGEVINAYDYEYEDGKLLNIIDYDDENYKTIIFENDRIKEIEEYEDNKLINTIKYENIIDANELENKYISDLNNYTKIYNPDKILEDIQRTDKKGKNAGYIYVLVNSSIKGMVKIGKTTRDPEERAKEISATTGVATPFVVAYECHFNDCSKAEKYIHNFLEEKNHRTSKQREFFNISSSQAIKVIIKAKEELDN